MVFLGREYNFQNYLKVGGIFFIHMKIGVGVHFPLAITN